MPEPSPQPNPEPNPNPAPNPNPPPNGGNPPGEFNYASFKEQIKDPEIKAAAERYTSFDEVFKSNNSFRTELADRIRLPGPNASTDELAKFRKGLGVPDDPKGYEVTPPKDVTLSDEDKLIIDTFRPIAHKYNVPAKAFNDFMGASAEISKQLKAAFEKQVTDAKVNAEAALRKEWSTDYDKNSELGKRAAKAHGSEEFSQFLDATILHDGTQLGAHPLMMKFLAAIGRKSDESDLFLRGNETERQTAQQDLAELQKKHPPGSPGYTDQAVQKRVRELFEITHGTKPVVGARGGGQ